MFLHLFWSYVESKVLLANYIIRDHGQLNQRFYDAFDHKFLYRKAQTLMFLVDKQEQFKELVKQAEETSKDIEDNPILSQDINEKYFEGLRAEIYFTSMHQFEGFFALLLAMFQKLPHWLYLTTYTTREIKKAIQCYVDDDIPTVTNGIVNSAQDFIIGGMYSGFYSEDLRDNSELNESIEATDWFIKRMGKLYLEATEYNAYKHGLRVLTGHSTLSAQLSDAAGNPQGQSFILGDSEDSLSFLELEDKGEGGQTVVHVTKHFNPKESFEQIGIMQLILDEVMRTRIARVKQERLEDIRTIYIKKDELIALRKSFTFRLTV